MKPLAFILMCALPALLAAQPLRSPLVRDAETALRAKDYPKALQAYQASFAQEPDNPINLYNAACAAAQTGQADLAFALLDRVFPAGEEWLIGSTALAKDSDLKPLQTDPRWPALVATVEKRYAEVQAGPLAAVKSELLAIHEADQNGRKRIKEIEGQHGRDSVELKALWAEIAATDAANLPKVEAILAAHGWLGPKQIGSRASGTLFLVIQHANLAVQQKYLPMMREAVKAGRAAGSSLALLEDRIALREGRPQIYGSQIGRDAATGAQYVLPLADPDHVDERRATVGLEPLAEYAKRFKITWDLETYKQQLPALKNPMAPQAH